MILFVCVHNAGRSVMAEAFAQARGLQATSAGTVPGGSPHPEVVSAMDEVGIDVSGHRARLLTDQMVAAASAVFTMGCAVGPDACPAILYADVTDWALDDPKDQSIERVRRIRDQIRSLVDAL